MINSRSLYDLHPQVMVRAKDFIDQCQASGVRVLIYSTYRDNEHQDTLYAKGRTAPGRVVTNAKGGQSIHNYRLAFDFVPLDARGHAVWDNDALWDLCGAIGELAGLTWGGRWTSFVDKPHMQWTDGLSIAELQAGAIPPFVVG